MKEDIDVKLLKHGSKIGNATVIVDIVDGANKEIRPRTPMKPDAITDHDTGNAGNGADAKAHNRLIHNLGDKLPRDTSHVSWHVSVDELFIIQHIPFDECAFHTGDGWLPSSGNRRSIGVEKCMHAGSDRDAIEANAIALYAYLLDEFDLPISSLKPHQDWSGKYCPALILKKYGSFAPFRAKVQAELTKGRVIPVSNPIASEIYRKGSTGAGVKERQQQLLVLGYKISVDGVFGKGTDEIVRDFQKDYGLKSDGVIGKDTDTALAKAVKAKTTKQNVYGVTVNGKQVNAFASHGNILIAVEKALKGKAKSIHVDLT